jgi:hypothetical protein
MVMVGEIIQAIDMNQSMDFEESLKMRRYLEEMQFNKTNDCPRYTLIGCPEVIYSEKISAVGRFMALQVGHLSVLIPSYTIILIQS